MNLFEQATETFIIINRIEDNDPEGGKIVVWQEGARIKGAMVYDRTMQAKIAQALKVSAVYTFICAKEIKLEYHTVLRRVSDGKVFRTTSDAEENKTPLSASLNMRAYDAEEWELTND